MDQTVMRGIGNSYADEILYHAHISPFSIANAIPEKAADRLFKNIQTVLEKAIRDIADANGEELTGELRDFMAIHNPALKITDKREVIKKDKIGGRTTYYTDKQELFQQSHEWRIHAKQTTYCRQNHTTALFKSRSAAVKGTVKPKS